MFVVSLFSLAAALKSALLYWLGVGFHLSFLPSRVAAEFQAVWGPDCQCALLLREDYIFTAAKYI